MTYPTHAPDFDWQDALCQTLDNLRSRWPPNWPGLPTVLQACMNQLWPPPQHLAALPQQMLAAANAIAEDMEQIANTTVYEPHYHNRLHTADALVSLCWLITALKAGQHSVTDEWAASLLLAVTSHDVLHPGGANSYAQEFEQQSVRLFQQHAAAKGVPMQWTEVVTQLILRTDPTLVAANHEKIKDTAFSFNLDWAVVLMNEADIAASAMATVGPQLGKQLASEWAFRQHPLHKVVGTDAGRLQFLSSLRFSTPASLALQMPQTVAMQIQQLKAQLGQ